MFKLPLGKKPQSSQQETTQENPQPETTEQNPTSQESQATAGAGTSSGSEPDWTNAPLPEAETVKAEPLPPPSMGGAKAQVLATPDGKAAYVMPYEMFHAGFCKAFLLGGHLTGFKTLQAAPERPTCPDASRAIYDIILDTPALHFLIMPEALWIQRAVTIGAFLMPVVGGVAAEMKERRMKPEPSTTGGQA